MTILRCPACGDWAYTFSDGGKAIPIGFTDSEAAALVALHISVAHVTAAGLMALLPPTEPRTSE